MKIWPFIASCLLFAVLPLGAWGGDWTASWETIRATAKGVRTIQADFVQKRELKLLVKPVVSKGKLAFRRPGDLRWEYTSPIETMLLAHEGAVERYSRRDGKLVADSSARVDAMATVMAEINRWLGGDFSSSKMFRPDLRHEGGVATVVLVPTDATMQGIIRSISLRLGQEPGTMSSIVIDEGSEGKTTIDFANVRVNVPLGDEAFTAR